MQAVSIDALHRGDGARLRRFLTRRLGNPADAADAHQETYLLMLAALTRTNIEQPSAFLFQIASNVARRMRNRQRLEGRIFQPVSDEDWTGLADAHALPEQQAMARQDLRRLAAAIDELPPRCREAFLLARIEGLPNGEVAARLGVSRNMVEKHLIKALLHCRRRCGDLF